MGNPLDNEIYGFNKIIEASAGSGKTYSLAKQFIDLLALYKGLLKVDNVLRPDGIGSIVAITFTNKAAGEMKERILNFLKELAGLKQVEKITEGSILDKKGALEVLIEIVENASDFNVTTIDSFMNRLLKTIAFDVKINPDYEVSFDSDELFLTAFNELLSDQRLKEDLLALLRDQLMLNKGGFNPDKILRKAIYEFKDVEIENETADFQDLLACLNGRFGAECEDFRGLTDYIENRIEDKLEEIRRLVQVSNLNNSRLGRLKNPDLSLLESPNRAVFEILNGNFDGLLKKNSKGKDRENLNTIRQLLKSAIDLYRILVEVNSIYKSSAVFRILYAFKTKEDELLHMLNVFDGGKISKTVSNYLSKDQGVSYAFSILGEKLVHYLIDEFQDTSLEQFNAILPLIENSLSQGGTLFAVGDRKQAIYAWRGGDYTLFDTLSENYGEYLERINLKKNFRSLRNIVEFNNSIFSSVRFINFISSFFADDTTFIGNFDLKERVREELLKIYGKNAKQDVVKGDGGYVRVEIVEEDGEFDRDKFNLGKLKSVLSDLVFEKGVLPKDIMILLRSKKDMDKVVDMLQKEFMSLHFITEDSLKIITNFEIKKLILVANALTKPSMHYDLELKEMGIELDNEIRTKSIELSPYEFFVYLIDRLNVDYYGKSALYLDTFLEKVYDLSLNNKDLNYIADYFLSHPDLAVSIGGSVNALRVMTIHKSKGLEAHTVIVPYYDWSVKKRGDLGIFSSIEDTYCGKRFFVKVNSRLSKVNKEAKEVYNRHLISSIIESINLMYVANTRAEKNLCIIGSYKKNKSGDCSSLFPVSCILHGVLDIDGVYEIGEIEGSEDGKGQQEVIDYKTVSINHSVRDYLKVYPKVFEPTLDMDAKRYGDLFHQAMAFIGELKDGDDVDKVALIAYEKAKANLGYGMDGVLNDVKRAINRLKNYFFGVEGFYNEKEFVDKKGDIKRVDRLVVKDGKVVIIDYKTGEKSRDHIEQVKGYLELFKGSLGLIYYTKTDEVVHVENS